MPALNSPAQTARPFHPLLRDLVVVVLLAAVAAGGYAWYRASQAAERWQRVERGTERFRFRLPPDWAATSVGYADPDFQARRAGGGVLLVVRSWAIPPSIHAVDAGADSPEEAAVAAWVEGQRGQALGARRILDERGIRVGGVRGVLQLFEDPRDLVRYSVVAAAARGGRLYTFSAQTGADVEPREAVRLVRRILGTVEWLPPAPASPPAPPRP
jgi:hypothetical protein